MYFEFALLQVNGKVATKRYHLFSGTPINSYLLDMARELITFLDMDEIFRIMKKKDAFLVVALICPLVVIVRAAQKPHVLLIVADDYGRTDVLMSFL